MSELKSNTEVRIGSERSFGLVFAAVFAVIALYPIWGGGDLRLWALAVAAVFGGLAFAAPMVLKPLNRLWFRFGLLLGAIVSPIVMAILFLLTVTPIGIIMRMIRKDPLNQTFDADAETYWIDVAAERTAPSSMRNQF